MIMRLPLTFLATLVLAAGCLGPLPDAPAPDERAIFERAYGAVTKDRALTRDDWYVLSAPATSRGGLAAYAWTVPPGAVTAGADGAPLVELEVAPIATVSLQPGQKAEGLAFSGALAAFRVTEGQAQPVGSLYLPSLKVTQRPPLVPVGSIELQPQQLARISLTHPNMAEGDAIVLVAAAGLDQATGELAFLVRVLRNDPANDLQSFLGRTAGESPALLNVTGRGDGLQVAAYIRLRSAVAGEVVLTTPTVKYQSSAPIDRAEASAGAWSLDSAYESSAGYAHAVGLRTGYAAAGHWSVEANVRGKDLVKEGAYAAPPPALLPEAPAPVGDVAFAIVGDGPGATKAHFAFVAASATALELIVFLKLDFGTPLPLLMGVPAAPDAWAGVVPAAAYEHAGAALTMRVGDGPWLTVLGLDKVA
jgi:hypothetical protein